MSEVTDGPARPDSKQIYRSKPRSVFELVGGQSFFDDLVHRFYEAVDADPFLRPMYPDDLGPPERHLALFLGQYWGGPPAYHEERGQPKLRLRHVPFVIGQAERDAWFNHMRQALVEMKPAPEVFAAIEEYLAKAATFLINA